MAYSFTYHLQAQAPLTLFPTILWALRHARRCKLTGHVSRHQGNGAPTLKQACGLLGLSKRACSFLPSPSHYIDHHASCVWTAKSKVVLSCSCSHYPVYTTAEIFPATTLWSRFGKPFRCPPGLLETSHLTVRVAVPREVQVAT